MDIMIKQYEKNGYQVEKYTYYIIEAYWAAWDKWYGIGEDTYGADKEHGEFTACGECWQQTGHHGTFNKEHAIDICNKLNEKLNNGELVANLKSWRRADSESIVKHGLKEFRVREIKVRTKTKIISQ